jgi:hypothetical protein
VRLRAREAVARIANHGGLVFCPGRVADALAARLDGLAGVEVISTERNVELAATLARRAASVKFAERGTMIHTHLRSRRSAR